MFAFPVFKNNSGSSDNRIRKEDKETFFVNTKIIS